MWFKKNKTLIYAPCDGEIIPLEKVEDPVFSEKMMGDGFAINPSSNNFYSPAEGNLVTVYETGHAYGIRTKNGIELLLHIGLDTVNLKGEGFKINVKQDQDVISSDLLVEVDLKAIAKKVPSTITPIVFPNLNKKTIKNIKFGKVKQGEVIAEIV